MIRFNGKGLNKKGVTKVKKGNFSKVLLLMATASLFVASSIPGLAAGPKYKWKLASVLTEIHPVHKTLVCFADRVKELTKGEAEISVFPAGQLGQEKDYIEGCKLGTIEITKISAAALGQFSDKLQVVSLPFIFRDEKHQHQVLDGKIGKILMADLEPKGFKGLAWFDAGFRNISLRDKPVRVPADLKGLKIRVMQSKTLIDTITAFGATAVPMGMGDVYTAIQTKVIDGWENNEPSVLSANMNEVCKFYSYTRHTFIPDIFIMSNNIYQTASPQVRKALTQAAAEATVMQRKIWAEDNDKTVKTLKARGMIFNEVNNIKDFQAIVRPVVKQYEKTVGAALLKQIINTK